MSKLYTQREVEKAIIEFVKNDYKLSHPNLDKVIASLTPIELPTDEEIDTYVESTGYYGHCTTEYREGIEEGAKWMRDKIKGGEQC